MFCKLFYSRNALQITFTFKKYCMWFVDKKEVEIFNIYIKPFHSLHTGQSNDIFQIIKVNLLVQNQSVLL